MRYLSRFSRSFFYISFLLHLRTRILVSSSSLRSLFRIIPATSPQATRTVALPRDRAIDQLLPRCSQIVRQADARHQLYETCGRIQAVRAQLRSLVIPRERVMVIVPTFTQCEERHGRVLRRLHPPAGKSGEFNRARKTRSFQSFN